MGPINFSLKRKYFFIKTLFYEIQTGLVSILFQSSW